MNGAEKNYSDNISLVMLTTGRDPMYGVVRINMNGWQGCPGGTLSCHILIPGRQKGRAV